MNFELHQFMLRTTTKKLAQLHIVRTDKVLEMVLTEHYLTSLTACTTSEIKTILRYYSSKKNIYHYITLNVLVLKNKTNVWCMYFLFFNIIL